VKVIHGVSHYARCTFLLMASVATLAQGATEAQVRPHGPGGATLQVAGLRHATLY